VFFHFSFVVTPVTFQDVYEISLQADFETHVPIPVVVVSPNQLDLDVLQQGLMPVINFQITNYGLIAAKGFQFQLPPLDTHPYMTIDIVSGF